MEKLMIIPLNVKVKVAGVDVTFIDANHCPGSVMILFEPPSGEVIISPNLALAFMSCILLVARCQLAAPHNRHCICRPFYILVTSASALKWPTFQYCKQSKFIR
jgi:hypothetical protein